MDEKDRLIDAGLASYPVLIPPPGFARRVLARLSQPQPRFRLDFLDLALPAFFALFAALSFYAALLLWAWSSPFWRLSILRQWQSFTAHLPFDLAWLLWPFGAAITSGIAIALLIASFFLLPSVLNYRWKYR